MSDYNELKALAELACPGPWMQENDDLYFDDDGYTRHMMSTDSGHDVCDDEFCDDAHRDNLKFIAAANPKAVLALIAENESLRKALRLAKPCVDRDMNAAVKNNFGFVDNDPWACAAVDARDAIFEALNRSPEKPS